MNIFKPIGKATRFVFVSLPAGMFGWHLNKGLFLSIRSFWTRSINPACPECDQGILVCDRSGDGVTNVEPDGSTKVLYPWHCHRCSFRLLAESNPRHVRELAARQRQVRAQAVFTDLELKERQKIGYGHRRASRIFYVASLLAFSYGFYLLASGASLIVALNWGSFALMFWVFGLKRAYRAWQVTEGHLFEAGAFWFWLRNERWLT